MEGTTIWPAAGRHPARIRALDQAIGLNFPGFSQVNHMLSIAGNRQDGGRPDDRKMLSGGPNSFSRGAVCVAHLAAEYRNGTRRAPRAVAAWDWNRGRTLAVSRSAN